MRGPDRDQEGIAMLVVLWVLVLMMALGTEFAFSTKIEVNTTRNYKEDAESYHLARAGIQLAMAEILKPARFHSMHPEHGWISGNVLPPQKPGQEPEEEGVTDFDVIEREDIPLGKGTITYSIQDENGKIAINTSSRELLVKILAASGLEVGEQRDIIADSILDWIDADSNHRINGAEDDYYLKQTPPHRAKNSAIETIDELLRVREMTEEILYGSSEEEGSQYTGLDKFITAYHIPVINPNTADEKVLTLLFKENQAQKILEAKETQGYYNNTLSTHFRIIATGKINNSRTKHTIVTVMGKTGKANKPTLLTHYWNDSQIE